MRSFLMSSLIGCAAFALPATAQTQGYYQTPTANDNVLIFASEGDLWQTNAAGGTAFRMTTHPEAESSPMLSPDGAWVAFQANYDGPSEIYIMPVAGGAPRQVTFGGGGVALRGWTPDGEVLIANRNIPGPVQRILQTVDINTFVTTDIPLMEADQAAFNEDGSTIFFTRYGLSMSNDNAVQYRGGAMAQLWRYDMGSDVEATRLAADHGAGMRHPMYWNGRVYFVSDKSGSDNIWSMSETGDDVRQETSSERWLMRQPYMHDGVIYYHRGADIYSYDLTSGETALVSLALIGDGDYQRERWLDDPLNYMSSAQISPEGDSVTVTARGHFVTAHLNDRRRIEYTLPEGTRARDAVVSGDGEWIYAWVGNEDRQEFWRFPVDGSGEGEVRYANHNVFAWDIVPVRDSAKVVFPDKAGRLMLLDPEAGTMSEIDMTESSNDNAFSGFNFTSDGRYMAYEIADARDIAQVAVYDFETGTRTVLTDGRFPSYSPAIAEDGSWLYFLSSRNYDPNPGSPWGDRNMGPAFNDRDLVYALQLDPEADFPFQRPDELMMEDADADEDTDEDEADEEAEDEGVVIDFDGAATRLWQVPVSAGNYSNLSVTGKHLYLIERSGRSGAIKRIELTYDEPELETYTSGVMGYSLSGDRSTILVAKRGDQPSFFLVDAGQGFPTDTGPAQVNLSDWKLRINPDDEWEQMANDAWRLHRDFAFDPNLRGLDWETVGEQFLPYADRIGHRTELNDLISQMSAELGILHSQIRQGDVPEDEESGSPAFLGASFARHADGLEIVDLYEPERDLLDTLGPLQQPGMDFREGDVITAINGTAIRTEADLSRALDHRAGEQVLVTYERNGAEMRDIVEPVSRRGQSGLYYSDWVQTNRERVAEASNGEIGYLHLRAMGSGDVASFARDFYEHFDKDGLIIDVRGNRGGNIDSWIIGTLLRQAWAFWQSPHGGPAYTNMQQAFRGHLVVLIDENTYSDGESFSAGVKALELAPLIGTRTAGAGIWLSDRNRLVDGGQARVAEYAQYGLDGRWLVEGYGIGPDVEVDTPPLAAYRGEDHQLDEALRYLEQQIASDPIPELTPQPIPPVGTPGRDVD